MTTTILIVDYDIVSCEDIVEDLSGITSITVIKRVLKSLKGCPNGITHFDLRGNQLTSLEYLSLSATHVRVSYNQIDTLEHIKNHINIINLL